jgi:hypothetical protein
MDFPGAIELQESLSQPCQSLVRTMTTKPKSPAKPVAAPKAPRSRQPVQNPLRQADNRWQRAVRYGWDKGGSNGGRK